MRAELVQELIGIIALSSVWMLGITRVRNMLWGLALQGCALGVLLMVRGGAEQVNGEHLLGAIVFVMKGIVIPAFLCWSAARLNVNRDKGAFLNPTITMLIGAAVLVCCHFESARFAVAGEMAGHAGLALATVVTGLLIMVTRRLALSLLIGFLVMDNGIFLYAFTQAPGLPVVIELGILFDLLMGVLLSGLVLFRVRTSFEHLDVRKMKDLHE